MCVCRQDASTPRPGRSEAERTSAVDCQDQHQAEVDIASSERDAFAKKAEAIKDANKEAREALENLQADQEANVK
jgi:hypothetical protein